MSKKETGWKKRKTEREGAEGENEVCQLSMTYYQSPGGCSYPPVHISPCTVRDKKRAHSHFLPLHQFPCYFPEIPRLPPASMHPAGQPDCLLVCLCSLPLRSHATGRVGYMKASSSPLISAWQRGWSWLRFRYTDPHSLASAQKKISTHSHH